MYAALRELWVLVSEDVRASQPGVPDGVTSQKTVRLNMIAVET
jgi:hypothetical protein